MVRNMSLMLDTYAILEFFQGTDKGETVKDLIDAEQSIHISVLSLYETGTVLERQIGKKDAQDYLRSLQTYYQIVDVTADIALNAVKLKRKFKLPAIDCLIYSSARKMKADVVSGCKHFKSIEHQKDVIVI